MVLGRPDVGHGHAPPLELDQDGRLQGVAGVGPSGAVEERDEPRVHGESLPRVHHPLPLGVSLDPHRAHEEAVLEVAQQLVDRVLGDAEPLRPERRVELLHAELPGGVAEQVADHPPQCDHLAHPVPLHHVPQDRDVHVVAQQLEPDRIFEPLRLGKPARPEVVEEGVLERRAFPRGEKGRPLGDGMALVPQGLLEAERMDHHLPRAPAHRRRHLAAQERSRGAAQEQLDLLRVEHPPHEPLPSRDHLNLVQAEGHRLLLTEGRIPPVVLLDQHVQLVGPEPCVLSLYEEEL